MRRHSQSGITLVVSLIMLIVLTLLVVSAIRFGSINLKIANNAQIEVEATAATQVAVEQMVKEMDVATKVDAITAKKISVSTGGTTYEVDVAKPNCILTRNIKSFELKGGADDEVCYEGEGGDKQETVDGKLTKTPTACKDQQWDVAASLTDGFSGAKVEMLQGVAMRVGAEIQCP